MSECFQNQKELIHKVVIIPPKRNVTQHPLLEAPDLPEDALSGLSCHLFTNLWRCRQQR